jgi:hypothetical protein
MPPDPLARFARVEPPAELDAWVRERMRAAVAQHAQPARAGTAARATALDHGRSRSHARAGQPARTATSRVPASMPLAERLALAVGAVACGVQASALVLRVVWNVLSLGR